MGDMERTVTCNDERRLFVIPSGDGYSCLGYDVCYGHVEQLSRLLGRPDLAPVPSQRGTLEQYDAYMGLVGRAASAKLGTYFEPGTPPRVREILEEARKGRRRLVIHLGDRETGKAWGDRPDRGTVGRSMGPIQVPLLIANSRSTGGCAILTSSIVRIQDAGSKRDLYVHPSYAPAEPHAAPVPEPEAAGMRP